MHKLSSIPCHTGCQYSCILFIKGHHHHMPSGSTFVIVVIVFENQRLCYRLTSNDCTTVLYHSLLTAIHAGQTVIHRGLTISFNLQLCMSS